MCGCEAICHCEKHSASEGAEHAVCYLYRESHYSLWAPSKPHQTLRKLELRKRKRYQITNLQNGK